MRNMYNGEEIYLQGWNGKGIFFLHGFGQTPLQLKDLAIYFNKSGYTVYCPVLPGHNSLNGEISPKKIFNSTPEEWENYALDEFRKFKQKVGKAFIGGVSIGGNIALKVATKEQVEGIIIYSTPIFFSSIVKIGAVAVRIVEFILRRKGIATLGIYHNIPVEKLRKIVKYIEATKYILPMIDAPLFISQATHDDVVDGRSSKLIYKRVRSKIKEIIWIKSNKHGINNGDGMNKTLASYMLNFIKRIQKN